MSLPSHHVRGLFGRTFRNPWPTWEDRGLKHLVRWWLERRSKARAWSAKLNEPPSVPHAAHGEPQGLPVDGWLTGNKAPSAAELSAAFPRAPTDWRRLASPPGDGVQVTWVGHATALVQLDGVNFLTDPVLAERCSPLSWAGPRRAVPSALDLFDPRCPRPHFVVLSHSHYDHLCAHTVDRLHAAFGHGPDPLTWYVPLGLRAWFTKRGIPPSRVHELDWWQQRRHEQTAVSVTCAPAQHWSARTPFDRMHSLWCSWAVTGASRRFWFAGDTGYCAVHKEIGDRLGPFDLSLIPIAAYAPRWFHAPAHLDPADAVRVHADVRSRRSIPIHVATWSLTDEALDAPLRELQQAAQQAGLRSEEFKAVQHGATVSSDEHAT